MLKKVSFALLALVAFACLPCAPAVLAQNAAPQATDASQLAWRRHARLKRGINLSHWFAQSPRADYSENHLKTHTTAQDVALIKGLGFDHVRFTVEPAPLMGEAAPAQLRPEYLRHLDSALDMLLAGGLAVVVDIHPSDEFKFRLRADDRAAAGFVDFWRALAQHLSRRDPERVMLEILNEPMVEDHYRWMGIQAKAAGAIREGAPLHTIVATGPRWSSVDQLLLIEPLADRNVIYNFHFYENHNFTHQGATWGAGYWPHLKGVPYPSSPETVNALLASIENEQARAALKFYGEERWDAARVDKEIAAAAAWGRKHNVPLVCNEFGVYRAYVREADRLRWIEDVRRTLEKYNIGWAMWDYAGSFSVVVKRDGTTKPDPGTVAALGLRMPAR
ncbi:MAG TPA: cellulase family glycosylhydrolase [Pyrinomonadaceae bacterium]|nr:cellulase family glycosylhydrolase [Pyrinomonadaceae bacterium]